MNMSAEFRIPIRELVIWHRERWAENRTADDGIPGEALGDVDVVPFHLREALFLWEWMRVGIVGKEQWGSAYLSKPTPSYSSRGLPWGLPQPTKYICPPLQLSGSG